MKTELMKVTPEQAKKWMQHNFVGNRKLSKERVDELVRIFKEGKYKQTHQGIAISKTGKLLDGQHRLAALIETGISVMMLVTTGLDEEAFYAIDIGKNRPAWLAAQLPKARAETWGAMIKVYGTALGFGQHVRPEYLIIIDARLSEVYESILEAKSFRRANATLRAAAVCVVLMELSSVDELRTQLFAFEHDQVEAMSAKVRGLWKGIVEKRISTTGDRRGLFTKSISALDATVSPKGEVKLLHSEERLHVALNALLDALTMPDKDVVRRKKRA